MKSLFKVVNMAPGRRSILVFAVAVLLLHPGSLYAADLVINEVMSNPLENGEYSFVDEDNVKIVSDWIEIYNPGDEPVDLRGLYLSDN